MNSRFSYGIAMMLAAIGALFVAADRAEAHAELVSADPAPEAAVASPQTIRLSFSEPVEESFSGFTVNAADGSEVALNPIGSSTDGKVLAATPVSPLSPGAYEVSWKVVSGDAHPMMGTFTFTVH